MLRWRYMDEQLDDAVGAVRKRRPGQHRIPSTRLPRHDAPARDRVLRALMNWQHHHPDEKVSLRLIAEEVGLSRERARQLYRSLRQDFILPHVVGPGEIGPDKRNELAMQRAILDEQVRTLRMKALTKIEMRQVLHVSRRALDSAIQRLIAQGKSVPYETMRHGRLASSLLHSTLDNQVRRLRQEQVMGTGEIAKQLGVSRGIVAGALVRLHRQGEVVRLRRHVSQKEAKVLADRIARLHEAGWTGQRIAKAVDRHVSYVYAVVFRLRKSGSLGTKGKDR